MPPYISQSPLAAAWSSMSVVTTEGDAGSGSPAPPDPCAASPAATSDATASAALQRAQCVILTSVEGPKPTALVRLSGAGLLPRPECEPQVHVAPGGRLIIAPSARVAHHRSQVGPVEHVVKADKRADPPLAHRPVPPQAHGRGPPRAGVGVERIVAEAAR